MAASGAAWERLGVLLTQRRAQLDPRYGRRTRFADARHLNYRIAYEIEQARRHNFGDGTIAAIEAAYDLAPGSLKRTLDGGPLEPAAPAPEPEAPSPSSGASASPAVTSAISALVEYYVPEVQAEISRARMRNPDVTGAGIFADRFEAAMFDLFDPGIFRLPDSALKQRRRIQCFKYIAGLRAQRAAEETQNTGSPGP